MKKINHTVSGFLFTVLIGVLIVSPLAAQAGADSDISAQSRSDAELVSVVAELEAHLAFLRALLADRLAAPTGGFSIQINDVAVSSTDTSVTQMEAETLCAQVAYNPANMWQLVTCTFDGDVLYRDVFIAG